MKKIFLIFFMILSSAMFVNAADAVTNEQYAINRIIGEGLKSIQIFCLSMACLLVILAIIRNYTQFGEHVGIRFIANLLISIVLIFCFPKIAKNVNKACKIHATVAGEKFDNQMTKLCGFEVYSTEEYETKNKTSWRKPSTWFGPVICQVCAWFFKINITILRYFRMFIYYVMGVVFIISLAFSPLMISTLCVPEAKSIGVGFICSTMGLCLIPLAFECADYATLWFMWDIFTLYFPGSSSDPGGMLSTLCSIYNVVQMFNIVGIGLLSMIIGIITYVITPFLFMKLFKTGAAGSPLGAMAAIAGFVAGTAAKAAGAVATGGTSAAAGAAAKGAGAAAKGAGAATAKSAGAAASGASSALGSGAGSSGSLGSSGASGSMGSGGGSSPSLPNPPGGGNGGGGGSPRPALPSGNGGSSSSKDDDKSN